MPHNAQSVTGHGDIGVGAPAAGVFSGQRLLHAPPLHLPPGLQPDRRIRMDGLEFLSRLPADTFPVAFFDPQYRGLLEKMSYGNEGRSRTRRRCALVQMSEDTIAQFLRGIDRALIPSGHLFLWVDKFHLCQGVRAWFTGTSLDIVDLVTWEKNTFGMGYRTRRRGEYCLVLQKQPRKAKGVWKVHDIPDVYHEPASRREHPHAKPVGLQGALLTAVSHAGDCVIDPAAGSFSVLQAAHANNRHFLGCDLNG